MDSLLQLKWKSLTVGMRWMWLHPVPLVNHTSAEEKGNSAEIRLRKINYSNTGLNEDAALKSVSSCLETELINFQPTLHVPSVSSAIKQHAKKRNLLLSFRHISSVTWNELNISQRTWRKRKRADQINHVFFESWFKVQNLQTCPHQIQSVQKIR